MRLENLYAFFGVSSTVVRIFCNSCGIACAKRSHVLKSKSAPMCVELYIVNKVEIYFIICVFKTFLNKICSLIHCDNFCCRYKFGLNFWRYLTIIHLFYDLGIIFQMLINALHKIFCSLVKANCCFSTW